MPVLVDGQVTRPARGERSAALRSRLGALLEHRRISLAAGLTAVLLSSPALTRGLQTDDYHHRAAILGIDGSYLLRGDIAHLYSFADGVPEHTMPLGEAGHAPWWGDPETRIAFFRPLSALSQLLDYRLWPDYPAVMHLHSLVWLFGVVLAAGAFYRSLPVPAAVAGLAVLLFAVDDAHAVPAAWLAQRNALVATLFGMLSLVAHHRARRDASHAAAVVACVLFTLALLSGEAGVATLAYLLAYASFLDRAPLPRRAASLLPYIVLTVAWRAGTSLAGFGTANVDMYIDPGAEPMRFLAAVGFRLPILFLGLVSPVSATFALIGPPGTANMLWALGLAALLLGLVVTWPLVRRDASARFLALGTLASLVPACATVPQDRMLLWSGLGAMGLVARFLWAVITRDATLLPGGRIRRGASMAAAAALVLVHLVWAPIRKPLAIWTSDAFHDQLYVQLNEVTLPAESVVIVNAPLVFMASHLQVMQAAHGLPVPGRVRLLAPSMAAVTLERTDERTLVLHADGGYLAHPLDGVYRSTRRLMPLGHRVALSDVAIEVVSLTRDGRPASVRFKFAAPLEDRSLRWVFWEQGRFKPWTPPPVGASATLPAPRPVL